MNQLHAPTLELHDVAPALEDFRAAVIDGLRKLPKSLPCKFFYDARGSRLFDRICEVDEYYPTRTELRIMRRHGEQIAAVLGRGCLLVEYGSGSSVKTRILLNQMMEPAGYMPIDISRPALMEASSSLAIAYPRLRVMPVCADYTSDFALPAPMNRPARPVVYFPGSTVGNFEPREAREFLKRIRRTWGDHSGLLIGVDLKKDPRILHDCYNDSAGVTAAFNRNLLARINRELEGRFILDQFAHYAFYNAPLGRIEMHLVSLLPQCVEAAGELFEFRQGESIFTESSYKYTLEEFAQLAMESGYLLERVWMDERRWFSVQLLRGG